MHAFITTAMGRMDRDKHAEDVKGLCLCESERFATHCGFFTLEDNAF
jgi:hypothetical protein